jgi:hypothetical protein
VGRQAFLQLLRTGLLGRSTSSQLFPLLQHLAPTWQEF